MYTRIRDLIDEISHPHTTTDLVIMFVVKVYVQLCCVLYADVQYHW